MTEEEYDSKVQENIDLFHSMGINNLYYAYDVLKVLFVLALYRREIDPPVNDAILSLIRRQYALNYYIRTKKSFNYEYNKFRSFSKIAKEKITSDSTVFQELDDVISKDTSSKYKEKNARLTEKYREDLERVKERYRAREESLREMYLTHKQGLENKYREKIAKVSITGDELLSKTRYFNNIILRLVRNRSKDLLDVFDFSNNEECRKFILLPLYMGMKDIPQDLIDYVNEKYGEDAATFNELVSSYEEYRVEMINQRLEKMGLQELIIKR